MTTNKKCTKYKNFLYLIFLSSEFIETVLVTFADAVFFLVFLLSMTLIISLHTTTESPTILLNDYYSHKHKYMCKDSDSNLF